MRAQLLSSIAALAIAVPAAAQGVRGKIVDATVHGPVVSALVQLRDDSDRIVSQQFTSPSGAFVLAGQGNAHYTLRVAAIGFARHATVDIHTTLETLVLADIVLSPVAVTLPAIEVFAGKRACGKAEITPETFGGLLESARTALSVMEATVNSSQYKFQLQLVRTLTVKHAHDSTMSADTSAGTLHEWPVRALSGDSLVRVGFSRTMTADEGNGRIYYGPDMQVLFSDWFLDHHCFTLVRNRSVGDTVVIHFEPAGKSAHVDISGDLVLDRPTLTLRRLVYQHRNLPNGFPDASAGGDMRFAEVAPGLWAPMEWAIWAPIVQPSRTIARPTMIFAPGSRAAPVSSSYETASEVVGRSESHGRVLQVVPRG